MLTESHKKKFITKARKYENTKKEKGQTICCFQFCGFVGKILLPNEQIKDKKKYAFPEVALGIGLTPDTRHPWPRPNFV